MGDYSFLTLKTNLKFELGQREDIDAHRGTWINAAYLDFCTRNVFWELKMPERFFFPELLKIDPSRATAANTKYIAAPTDALGIYHVHDTTNDLALDYYHPREYARKTGRNTVASYGKPAKWTRMAGRLYFYPTPDAVYNLEITYRKKPALLINDTDKTEVDSIWDEPILKLAVVQSFYRMKRYDTADIEKREWITTMAGKLGTYDQDQRSSRTPIQPDYAYKIAGEVR